MFAVLKTGGKQYKVVSGDILRVEKLAGEAGDTVQFNEILLLGGEGPVVGTPTVKGAGVQAEILEQTRGKKLINFVKRRRKHSSQRKKGHRQYLTVLRVTDILTKGADKTNVAPAQGQAPASDEPKTSAAKAAPAGGAAKKSASKKPAAEKVTQVKPAEKQAKKPAVKKATVKKATSKKPAAKKAPGQSDKK